MNCRFRMYFRSEPLLVFFVGLKILLLPSLSFLEASDSKPTVAENQGTIELFAGKNDLATPIGMAVDDQ